MRTIVLPFVAGAWLIVAVLATQYLWRYASTAGAAALAPSDWPAASSLKLSNERHTLVFALHPHCPCSRASVEELARLLTENRDSMAVYALLVAPVGVDSDWADTSLAKTVSVLPGVKTVVDQDAREAELFGAKTSGEALLYDTSGRLVFHGGITDSRGHAGDNAGHEAISKVLSKGSLNYHITPVYGCPLLDKPDFKGKAGNASCKSN